MQTVEELQKELEAERAKGAENIKALQQKLTEKDIEHKKTLERIEELEKKGSGDSESVKKIAELTETVTALTSQIGEINSEKKREELRQKYPDILPDLLIGKNDAEIEALVEKQRAATQQTYGARPSAHEPQFKDRSEVDAEIQRVKEDKSIDTDTKLVKVRELERRKSEF